MIILRLRVLRYFVLYDDERPTAAEALVHYKLGRQFPMCSVPRRYGLCDSPQVFPRESLWVVVKPAPDLGCGFLAVCPQPRATRSEQSTYFLAQGIYFGLIAMLVVIGFVLWAVLRAGFMPPTVPLHSAPHSGFATERAAWPTPFYGLGYRYGMKRWMYCWSLGAMCSVEFTNRFLQLERYLPFWNHGLMGLNGLWGMVAFTGLFGPEQLGFGLAAMLILIGGTTLYGVGLMPGVYRCPSRYYLLAWTVLILGACLLMLNYLGFSQASSITDHLRRSGWLGT